MNVPDTLPVIKPPVTTIVKDPDRNKEQQPDNQETYHKNGKSYGDHLRKITKTPTRG